MLYVLSVILCKGWMEKNTHLIPKTILRPTEILHPKEQPIRINAVYLIFSLKMKINKDLQRI